MGGIEDLAVALVLILDCSINLIDADICQRIYLGAGRRKKKDKQRRADLEMEREESEEATLPKRSSRSARGAGREQRRVTLQRRRRQSAADKAKLLEAGGSTLVGQRPKENDHKHSKRSKEKG